MSDDSAHADILNVTAQGQIKSIIARVERLEQEKSEVAEQIKEVFAEAKGNGFDVKILRKLVRIRKQDDGKRQEEEAILDLYMSAMGDLPLFETRADTDGGIDTITLKMGDGRSVSGTPDQLAVAERMVRGVPEDQALYDQAVALVRRDGKAAVSYVQRRLQLGYNKAASLVEQMERAGVVTSANHAGKRTVVAADAVH